MAEYINKDAAIDVVAKWFKEINLNGDICIDGLRSLQAADVVERKTWKWILSEIQRQEDVENGNYQYHCSNCGKGDVHAKGMTVPYCWHCGAQMIGGDDNGT